MKSQLVKLSLAIATILSCSNALAFQRDGKVYMDINIGYGLQNVERKINIGTVNYNFKENNKGVLGKVGVGYHLLDEIRVGVSAIYTPKIKSSKSNGTEYGDRIESKKMGVFADVYYDFLTGSRFNPFLFGGLGMMQSEYKQKLTLLGFTDNAKKTRTKMAYKLGAGISYHINTSVDLDFTYQAILSASSKKKNVNMVYNGNLVALGPTVTLKPAMFHSLLVGVRYTF